MKDICHGLRDEENPEIWILKPCKYLPTKPGNEPPEIREALATAAQITEWLQIGFTLKPTDLNPTQMAAVTGAHRGKGRAEATAYKRREKASRSKGN